MFNKSTILTLTVLLLVIVGVGYFAFNIIQKRNNAVDEETKKIFSDVSDIEFSYTDINGNKISLEQFLGQVLVVTSWASWSPFSRDELTNLNDLSTKYSNEKIVFLAINRKETKEQAQRFISTLPELKSVHLVLDPRDHFYISVEGYAMPETVIYDSKGTKIKHFRGKFDYEEIEVLINDLVNNN